jgi:hypothetical protein
MTSKELEALLDKVAEVFAKPIIDAHKQWTFDPRYYIVVQGNGTVH